MLKRLKQQLREQAGQAEKRAEEKIKFESEEAERKAAIQIIYSQNQSKRTKEAAEWLLKEHDKTLGFNEMIQKRKIEVNQ